MFKRAHTLRNNHTLPSVTTPTFSLIENIMIFQTHYVHLFSSYESIELFSTLQHIYIQMSTIQTIVKWFSSHFQVCYLSLRDLNTEVFS